MYTRVLVTHLHPLSPSGLVRLAGGAGRGLCGFTQHAAVSDPDQHDTEMLYPKCINQRVEC